MKNFIPAVSVLILASLACQTLTNPQINVPTSVPDIPTLAPNLATTAPDTPSVTPVPATKILFQDDFSNADSKWGTADDGSAKLGIEDGKFRIQIKVPKNLYWTSPGENFSDVHIEVDAEKAAGPDPAEYGVICRYNETNGNYNFYYLVIAGDTYASIMKVVNGSQVEISKRDIKYDVIHSGNATNHITVDCIGNRLSLSANGTELFSVTDDSISSGDVGLIATTYVDGGIDVKFDNFVVTGP